MMNERECSCMEEMETMLWGCVLSVMCATLGT